MAKLSDIISTPDLAGYVRDSEAITWAEPQTFVKDIASSQTGVKHNFASFRVDSTVADGADALNPSSEIPDGWSITKISTGVFELSYGQDILPIPLPVAQPINTADSTIFTQGVQYGQCTFTVRAIDSPYGVKNADFSVQVAY